MVHNTPATSHLAHRLQDLRARRARPLESARCSRCGGADQQIGAGRQKRGVHSLLRGGRQRAYGRGKVQKGTVPDSPTEGFGMEGERQEDSQCHKGCLFSRQGYPESQ